jgi:hypothetical protein
MDKKKKEEFKELVKFYREKFKILLNNLNSDILTFCMKYGYKGIYPEAKRSFYIFKPIEFDIWLNKKETEEK